MPTTTTTGAPVTTTTTMYTPIRITRYPSGNISPGERVTFSVNYGVSECTQASYKWYLDDILVGTTNPLVLTFNNITTHSMYVIVTEYTTPSWLGGEFYGGTFKGLFSGGTFNYGNLNDCCYVSEAPKSKQFTIKI